MPPFRIRHLLLFSVAACLALTYWKLTFSSSTAVNMGSTANQLPLRLAILEADTPQPNSDSKYHGYTGIFTNLLERSAALLSPARPLESVVTIKGYHVVDKPNNYPPLDEVDALLLTGSKHTAADDIKWINKLTDYTRQAIEGGRIKVIGVCFGHQIVGRALGAKLGRSDKGWEIAVTEVGLTPEGVKFFHMPKMRIHQMHRDIVYDYPSGAIPIGSNDICTNQGMYLSGRYITVQGHPEFTEEIISEVLVNRNKQGIFADDVYKEAMSRAGIEHDGAVIGKTFLEFLMEG